jgi:hypothetical protein
MPETWIFVVGGIIATVIAFTIAYNLISSFIELSQKQNALTHFSNFYSDVRVICIEDINNYLERKFSIPSSVRVVYATSDTVNLLPKVVDLIKSQQNSSGQNICLQFMNEQSLRCQPESPSKLPCNIKMPYLGTLPESEDIWAKVSKILGRSTAKEYDLFIQKTGGNETTISFYKET